VFVFDRLPTVNDNILLVDDDTDSIQVMARLLSKSGQLRFATCGEDAIRLALEHVPDLILLDAEMPGMSGYQVFETLKALPALQDVPVIFVTQHVEAAFEVSAFDMGAVDFIAKPVHPAQLRARVRTQLRIKALTDELRRTANTDGLTGVANRRQADEALEREWLRARRSSHALAVLMVDLDHFTAYNERYGHPAGDACLRKVARTLVDACLRPGDLVARYGGEEFMLLMPETPRRGAEQVAHRILGAIESLAIPHEASRMARHVTASVGVGCYDSESECWTQGSPDSRFMDPATPPSRGVDLIRAAEKALGAAKHAGRAQARLLDMADVDGPRLARDLMLSLRDARRDELL